MKDPLGDRMKAYEEAGSGQLLMPLLPALARIDGRSFHAFTKDMKRPFDADFSHCMKQTTVDLMMETNACMGYTQSDEITLCWCAPNYKSQIYFNGRSAKMTSQLAAQATLSFYRHVLDRMPSYAERLPTFDCRVWNVPNKTEAVNVFIWREWDATKNSIQMAAQSVFSHHDLHGKHGGEMQEMLHSKGINWNDYASDFKRGIYIQRQTVAIPFSASELAALPERHEARSNPDLLVERSAFIHLEMPPLTTIANREAVIFEGASPEPMGQTV